MKNKKSWLTEDHRFIEFGSEEEKLLFSAPIEESERGSLKQHYQNEQ